MISIKGSVLRTRMALVEELAPADGLKRVLARLTGPERDVLSSLLASAWYPFESAGTSTTRSCRSWAGGPISS